MLGAWSNPKSPKLFDRFDHAQTIIFTSQHSNNDSYNCTYIIWFSAIERLDINFLTLDVIFISYTCNYACTPAVRHFRHWWNVLNYKTVLICSVITDKGARKCKYLEGEIINKTLIK